MMVWEPAPFANLEKKDNILLIGAVDTKKKWTTGYQYHTHMKHLTIIEPWKSLLCT